MHTANAIAFYTDQEVSEYHSSKGGSRQQLVFGLNNGIEIEEIAHLRVPYLAARRSLDLLFVGRITPKSELELLLTALALPSCSSVRLDVIGDGEAKARLRQRCFELGISDRVTWHDATTEEARIAEVANKCKAFVYPGAVGLSLIHGLAYGLPAIVHDNRWAHMPEIAALRAGENGVTFRKGRPDDLASTVAALIADPRRLEALSSNAIRTTDGSYNAADMANRFCVAVTTVHGLLADT
jgi:glycosyltransferase involved in cell wall biosynthesis